MRFWPRRRSRWRWRRAAKSSGARDTVATIGVCDVFPGAVNSIPSRVRLEMDVRDIDLARRDDVLRKIAAATEEIAARRDVTHADGNGQRRSARAVRSARCRRTEARLRNAPGVPYRTHDQPRVSRFAVHVARSRRRPCCSFRAAAASAIAPTSIRRPKRSRAAHSYWRRHWPSSQPSQ